MDLINKHEPPFAYVAAVKHDLGVVKVFWDQKVPDELDEACARVVDPAFLRKIMCDETYCAMSVAVNAFVREEWLDMKLIWILGEQRWVYNEI